MSSNTIGGKDINKNTENEGKSSCIDFYIGVFFDGTNNNKYQVMLGKMYRRKEIFAKAEGRLKQNPKYGEIHSVNDILKMPREKVEAVYPDVFTRSELEYLYFGYGDINDSSSSKFDTFIEQKSNTTLGGKDPNQLTSTPDSKLEQEGLKSAADSMAQLNDYDNRKLDKYKGAPAQNSTYTNVAILEGLYKCESKTDSPRGNIEKHISIYIEGSGSDMQVEAYSKLVHNVGHGSIGLGKGTGPSGAVSKVRKAVTILEQKVLEANRPQGDETRTFNLHFDVCGFSRGSASARMFCYVISPDRDNKEKSYDKPNSIINNAKDLKLFTNQENWFLNKYKDEYRLDEFEVRNLLIADTVSSIGVIYNEGFMGSLGNWATRAAVNAVGGLGEAIERIMYVGEGGKRKVDQGTGDIGIGGKRPYHYQNVNDYGLWATELVQNVIHICALDEVRRNFALTDIESSIGTNGREIFIPGCHTDLGGGAAIGMENVKILNLSDDRSMVHYHAHILEELKKESAPSRVMPLNVDTLYTIGWLDDTESIDRKDLNLLGRSKLTKDETYHSEKRIFKDNIFMYRHMYPGYSNVSLNCFRDLSKGSVFNDMPPSFAVPMDLKNLYDVITKIEKPGRYFLYPETPSQYYELRRKYLHFSCNEQVLSFADNDLVNGPEFADINEKDKESDKSTKSIYVNSRIIYSGEYLQNDDLKKKRMHMFDYGKKSDVLSWSFGTQTNVQK